jgi:Rps23 Pro-64 3,4-dihydroxylase Tpa1-like proline 4-hydroxylase
MNFKKKSLTTSCGKFIDIYDGVFSVREQEFFETRFKNLSYTYQITKTNSITSHLPSTFLHCKLNSEDVQSFGFFDNSNIKQILSHFDSLEFNVAWNNLSLPGTYYQKHTDIGNILNKKAITLMYYGTTTWQDSYGGETFFYNDFNEKEIVVDYLPGRVVIFDSSICHKPAFSYGHVVGRYTFVTLFFTNN